MSAWEHLCFSSRMRNMGVEVSADPEVGDANQIVKHQLDRGNVAALFSKHEDAQ